MTDRLTTEWTKTSEQAFGESGRVGDLGEHRLVQIIRHIGFRVEHYTDNRTKQNQGIDIEAFDGDHPLTIDAKTNLKYNQYMRDFVFYVECERDGWLFNPKKKSNMFIHFSLDNELMVLYNRKDMQDYVMRHRDEWKQFNGTHLMKFNLMSVPDFVIVSAKEDRDEKFGAI